MRAVHRAMILASLLLFAAAFMVGDSEFVLGLDLERRRQHSLLRGGLEKFAGKEG